MRFFSVALLPFLLPVLLVAAIHPTTARAWESLPEFQSLTEEEPSSFDGPNLLNSQYFSELLTYTAPSSWEYAWLIRPKVLELNYGSLNTLRFLTRNRLKIHHPISERFQVRYTYFDESSQEHQNAHNVLELVWFPHKRLGLVLYGEPSFRKSQDDTGLALLLELTDSPENRHELRLFQTFIDVTRLKYPDRNDTFIEPDLPYARGIVGRAWGAPETTTGQGDFLEYALRQETRTRWQFNDDQVEYRYWKWLASFYARRQFSARHSAAVRAQFDRKHESKIALGPEHAPLGDWLTNRIQLLTEYTSHRLSRDWDGTFGLEYVGRTWNTEQGLGTYRDLLPYIRATWHTRNPWELTYALEWHQEAGPATIGIRPDQSGRVDHRLNVSYHILLRDQGQIVLMAAADIDKFGTRRSWGGGSGRLQLFF